MMMNTEMIPTATKIIEGEPQTFRENFNRASFEFAHHLANHPLFDLTRLIELASALAPREGGIFYNAGNVEIGQRWDQTPPSQMSVGQLIDRIENSGAWITIKKAHEDPQYAAILNQGLAEIETLVGTAYPKKIQKIIAYVFIASPKRITTYHIDRDCTFLLQVRGTKVISIFDKSDRLVLPEQEIEQFWAVDNNSAVYKREYQDRATQHLLVPGNGVHIPILAPHWVQNDDNISVSLGLSFHFQNVELGNVYRCNYYLRKLGFSPAPPGRSRLRDAIKRWTMSGAAHTRDACKWIAGRKH